MKGKVNGDHVNSPSEFNLFFLCLLRPMSALLTIDKHQNHNCLHCCQLLILKADIFNFKIDLFQRLYLLNKSGGKAFFPLQFWLLLRLKLLVPWEKAWETENSRLKHHARLLAATTCLWRTEQPPTVLLNQMHSANMLFSAVARVGNIIR